MKKIKVLAVVISAVLLSQGALFAASRQSSTKIPPLQNSGGTNAVNKSCNVERIASGPIQMLPPGTVITKIGDGDGDGKKK